MEDGKILVSTSLSKHILVQNITLNYYWRYLLSLCLLAGFYYGWPIIIGSYLRGWDAPTHIFFASGYLEDWWSVWDTRWYGGYSKTAYPPLAHQVVALATLLVGNIELSYGLLLWLTLTISPIAMYQFATVFVDKLSGMVAAFLFLFAPSTRIMLFTHGQFAGFVSLLFAMLTVSAVRNYIWKPCLLNGIKITFFVGCSLASHQATNVFFLIPALCLGIYSQINQHWPKGIQYITIDVILKPIIFVLAGVMIGLPFLNWLFEFQMQRPIPHPSRINLLTDYSYLRIFFLDNYGALLALIPIVIWYSFQRRGHILLVLSFVLFMGLGLGGTTPLPSVLFGPQWEWLTYERFNTWAVVLFLPVAGHVFLQTRNTHPFLMGKLATVFFLLFASFLWLINPELKSTTAPLMDLRPVYDSLTNDELCKERYLALGFGHQLPRLSTHTDAKTLDGLWHTARSDPFLRSSGIGSLSDALYWDNGDEVLTSFLARDRPVAANCIYINDIEPKAQRLREIVGLSGWYLEKELSETISLWRKKNTSELANTPSTNFFPQYELNYPWGILPVIFLFGAIVTSSITVIQDIQDQ